MKTPVQEEESQTNEDLVYDVGAHEGEDSDFYLKLGYRVVAIEGNPFLVDKLKKRFHKEIQTGAYVLVPYAIGTTNQESIFYINKKVSVWGTANPNWAVRNTRWGAESEEIKIQFCRFIEILMKYGCPNYLKIDIEGSDMLCISDLRGLEKRPKYVSIESTVTSWSDLINEFNTLDSLGYKRFKVIKQGMGHKRGRFVSIKGTVIDYVFGEGASGPFGKYLQGPWLTKKLTILRCLPIFLAYKLFGVNTVRSAILARIPILRRVLGLVTWYDTHAIYGP